MHGRGEGTPTFLLSLPRLQGGMAHDRPQGLPWPPGTESMNQCWPSNSQDEQLTAHALRGVPWVVNSPICLVCPHREKKSRSLSQACQNSLCHKHHKLFQVEGRCAGWVEGPCCYVAQGKMDLLGQRVCQGWYEAHMNPFRHPGVAQVKKCPVLP